MTHAHTPRTQQGIALIVVLILLLVMSLLAIVSLRATLMEERMSANMADRSMSFQAAEAALRQGEQVAANKPAVPGAGCSNGICAIPVQGAAPRWSDQTVWNASAKTITVNLGTQTAQPKYIVELLANDIINTAGCPNSDDVSAPPCATLESRYRITALSEAAGRSAVMLQSNFAVP